MHSMSFFYWNWLFIMNIILVKSEQIFHNFFVLTEYWSHKAICWSAVSWYWPYHQNTSYQLQSAGWTILTRCPLCHSISTKQGIILTAVFVLIMKNDSSGMIMKLNLQILLELCCLPYIRNILKPYQFCCSSCMNKVPN